MQSKSFEVLMKKIIFGAILLSALVSCVGPKQLRYMQDLASDEVLSSESTQAYQLQAGDQLTIRVSSFDHSAVAPFNIQDGTLRDIPFIIDQQGNLSFPGLGEIAVAGKTVDQVSALLQTELGRMAKGAVVRVELVSAFVSVLGEVAKPGYVGISKGRLTIMEALASAGDLTPYGRRDNVLISREVNGKMEFARLDLTKADVLTSPYYYLQQNDVIYVSPNSVRAINSTNVSLWLSMVSTVASAATVIVTVVNAARK